MVFGGTKVDSVVANKVRRGRILISQIQDFSP